MSGHEGRSDQLQVSQATSMAAVVCCWRIVELRVAAFGSERLCGTMLDVQDQEKQGMHSMRLEIALLITTNQAYCMLIG